MEQIAGPETRPRIRDHAAGPRADTGAAVAPAARSRTPARPPRPSQQVMRNQDDGDAAGRPHHRQPRTRPSAVPVGEAPPAVYQALRRPGAPLDARTRTRMEERFGTDFSRVRVHTGALAAASASAVNAAAYTVGNSIVFGAGYYAPATPAGRHVLAHELMHTVQQSRTGPLAAGQRLRLGPPASPGEHEAQRAGAARPAGGGPAATVATQFQAAPVVQRQIRIRGRIINETNEGSYLEGIQKVLDDLVKTKARESWRGAFRDQIRSRIIELIRSDQLYPSPREQFPSYKAIIEAVARELAAGSSAQRVVSAELPPLDPVPVSAGPISRKRGRKEADEPLLPRLRRTASDLREKEPDKIREEFHTGSTRRRLQKAGVLSAYDVHPVAIGLYSGRVQFTGNEVVATGGKGATYAELWNLFSVAIGMQRPQRSQQEAAAAILAMLHGEPGNLRGYGEPALLILDQILAIEAGAEQARATVAVLHFAATVNAVAKGSGTLRDAFAGKQAIFLGANKGGADALRGNTKDALLGQQERADEAAQAYLQQYGKGFKNEPELIRALMDNIASYSRIRQSKASSQGEDTSESKRSPKTRRTRKSGAVVGAAQ